VLQPIHIPLELEAKLDKLVPLDLLADEDLPLGSDFPTLKQKKISS